MNVPFYIFLIPYFIAIVVVVTFALFNIYHIYRYALATRMSVAVTSIFVIGLIVMLGVSIVFVYRFDWTDTFRIVIGL